MKTPFHHALVGSAAVALFATCAPAASDVSNTDRLEARIAELETRLAQYEQRDQRLCEQRSAEIRSLVHDMLADADTRASLLGSGLTAGYDNGFTISSPDGNFLFRLGADQQVRFIYNRQRASAPPDTDRHRSGFENALTRLRFSGHIVDPSWIYAVFLSADPNGGTVRLLDAYIGKALGGGWTVLAGQFRVPLLREWLVLEQHQLAVARSLIHQEFTGGRTQGVALDYRNDWLHLVGGFTDGHHNTGGFNSPALAYSTEFSLTGRGEVLVAGSWEQFADFTSFPGDEFGLMIGAAIHWQKDEYGVGPPATPREPKLEVVQWTVDASVEFGGANLFAYFVGRHLSGPISLDQYGFVVQGGLFITDGWEVFARYEWGDDDMPGPDLHVITAGVNHYIARHNLKWTSDIGYGLREVTSTWGDGFIGFGGMPVGWRTDGGRSGQIVLRSQLQLSF